LICEYVDEVFPDPPLVPKDTAGRAHMRVWSKYVDEGLFDGVAELSFSAMFRGVLRLLPHRWAVERRPSEVREFASSLDGEATGPVTIVVIAPCVSLYLRINADRSILKAFKSPLCITTRLIQTRKHGRVQQFGVDHR